MTDEEDTEYLTAVPERRLQLLAKELVKSRELESGCRAQFFEGRIIELTTDMDEHPKWHDDICNCRECRSCG